MTSYYNGHEYNSNGEYSDGMAGGVLPIAEGSVPSVSLYDFIEEVLRTPAPQNPKKAIRRSSRVR